MRLPEERPEDREWSGVREHDVVELWDHSIAPNIAAAYAARLELLEGLAAELAPPGGRVLDVGCAQGTLGLRLAERGYRVSLVDVRAGHIAYARARRERGDVDFHVGLLSETCPPRNDYDVVFCTEVIEHVPAPSELLAQLRGKLRPGGALVLTTPNAECVAHRLPSYGRAAQGVIDSAEVNSADGDAHRFLYAREELVSVVRSVGLRVERTGFFLPFWLDGFMKTWLVHRAFYRATGRLAQFPKSAGAVGRYVCTSQWLVARASP